MLLEICDARNFKTFQSRKKHSLQITPFVLGRGKEKGVIDAGKALLLYTRAFWTEYHVVTLRG